MTELLFAGGLVRIDETLVWRKLTDWLGLDDGREVRMWRGDAEQAPFFCTMSKGDRSFTGQSALSAADALAQALQIAFNAGELQ